MDKVEGIEEDFERQVEAVRCLLALAKQHKIDGSHESLFFIFAPLFQVVTVLYESLYTYYVGVGAPGGESQEEMIAWFHSILEKKGEE